MKTSHCRHTPQGGRKPHGGVSLDTLGIIASTICMVHCLALPVVLVAMPTVTARLMESDYTHFVLAGAVTAFCLLAIVPGYLRHNHKTVLGLMIAGLSLVLTATFFLHPLGLEGLEMPLISLGNILVVIAHVCNRRLLHSQAVTTAG